MQRFFVLNLSLALLWLVLNSEYSLRTLLIGFILGFVLLSIVQRRYGYYVVKLSRFSAYVLYAILESNLRLAIVVLSNTFRSTPRIRPGIVAVPLVLTNPLDITVLASIITLTPGTLSVDLGEDAHGQEALFVHTIHITSPETFRAEIKRNFEQPLLELRHLLEEMNEEDNNNRAKFDINSNRRV